MSEEKPREIAVRVLRQRQNGIHIEDLLENSLAKSRLSPADRGLCQELCYGVARWQASLDWLIERKTPGRTQKPALQDILRLGLYQLFWLDRIPAHAAVHESVELARIFGFGPQTGFVNAILRGYVREMEPTRLLLANLKISTPHVGWSHPQWLADRWTARWGAPRTAELFEWDNNPPAVFARVNTLVTDPGKLLERWREENVEYDFVRRDWIPEGQAFELKSHPPLHKLGSFLEGWFYVQDPSTLLASSVLDAQPGERVLDMCSAPGGKLAYIAQFMRNEGCLVAHDLFPDRLVLVSENVRRMKLTCVELCPKPVGGKPQPGVIPIPASSSGDVLKGPFDRILVDAPCSNSGVMRRRVDLRWRIRPEEIERLTREQSELLRRAARLLKPGGTLVYSTCSLEPEENSGVIRKFLADHPAFELRSERELIPFVDHTDGAYVARFDAKKTA